MQSSLAWAGSMGSSSNHEVVVTAVAVAATTGTLLLLMLLLLVMKQQQSCNMARRLFGDSNDSAWQDGITASNNSNSSSAGSKVQVARKVLRRLLLDMRVDDGDVFMGGWSSSKRDWIWARKKIWWSNADEYEKDPIFFRRIGIKS